MSVASGVMALVEALEELAAVMQSRGERGRIYVAGGAAMILAHAADRLTRDVDAAQSQRWYHIWHAEDDCIFA